MGDPRPVPTDCESSCEGCDAYLRPTGNGPTDPRETEILRELFGDPDGGGVYAPYLGSYEGGDDGQS